MKNMKIPKEFVSRFESPGINISLCIPVKLREALIARAYQRSSPEEMISMGEVARDLLMRAIGEEETQHG